MTAPDGWTRVDTHVKVLDEAVLNRARERGIDALVYAPHFTRLPAIRERAAAFSDDDLLVVPGREVFTGSWRERKHVLAVGLTDPVPDFITLAGAMREFERQDAVVVVPHPDFANISMAPEDVRRFRSTVDAVETYNAKLLPRHNRRARAIARSVGAPRMGCSYAHLHPTVGAAWTAFRRPIHTEADLLDALREPADPADAGGRRVAHFAGPRHRVECTAEFGHLFWENSWGKLDRVFLSGMDPTHPRHVAYDGRFDDVAVY